VILVAAAVLLLTRQGGDGGTPQIVVDQQQIDYGYVKFGETRPSRSQSPIRAPARCASRRSPILRSWRAADPLN
jgi:hypothetical protein